MNFFGFSCTKYKIQHQPRWPLWAQLLIYARLSSQTILPVGSFPITRRTIQDGKNHGNAISYNDKIGRSVAELNKGPGAWVSLEI
jgi:hypothetical protein